MLRKNLKHMKKSCNEKCQMCGVKTLLVEHHLRGRDIPKANHPDNLSYICSNCHNLIHHDILIVEGWWKTSNGRELIWRKKEDESITGQECKPPLY